MGKRVRVWGWQDPTQVIAQEMARQAKSEQQGDTMDTYQAFVLALRLAITAPTDSKSQQSVTLANCLALRLTETAIARAKDEATRDTNLRLSDSMFQQGQA